MSKVYHIKGLVQPRGGKPRQSGAVIARLPSADLEPGIEIALTWLEQTGRHQERTGALACIAESVLHMVDAELMLALDGRDKDTTIWFASDGLPLKKVRQACDKDGFFAWLARIRFAHVFGNDSPELRTWLPRLDPPVTDMLAVPLFRNGAPGECLVVAKRIDKKPFEQGEVMLLSLAAAILSSRPGAR